MSKYLNLNEMNYNTTFSLSPPSKEEILKSKRDHEEYMEKLKTTIIKCPICKLDSTNQGGYNFKCTQNHKFSIN